MEWFEGAMVFHVFIFIFLFRNNGKWEQLDENDFRHCYGIFFESVILNLLDHKSQPYLKFFFNNCKTTWQRHLKYTLQLKILWALININVKPALRRTLHQDIWLIIVCFSFSHTSLVFEFNLVLMENVLPQFIYLFTYRCVWSSSSTSTLFYKNL